MRIVPQDLRSKDRVKLWDVVPLTTPFLVYFDPSSFCNLKCSFCPTGHKEFVSMRQNGVMKWNLFTSVVDQFKEFPDKIRHVTLCKDGDPLVNKRFPEMVKYLADADIADKIITKTNGLLLTPEINTKLAASGLNQIGVSVKHVDPAKYEQITGVYPDYDGLVRNVTDLYHKRGDLEIYVSMLNVGLTQAEIDKYYRDFEPISDYIAVEDLHGWSMSDVYDFSLGQEAQVTPLSKKIACPLTLCAFVVNATGTVSMCGEDWAEKTVVGDLNKQTVKEVWNSPELRAFRMMHLEGRRRENLACGTCQYLETLPDNIDNHLEILKGRL